MESNDGGETTQTNPKIALHLSKRRKLFVTKAQRLGLVFYSSLSSPSSSIPQLPSLVEGAPYTLVSSKLFPSATIPTMPKVPGDEKRRIQRYYPLSKLHSRFCPEPLFVATDCNKHRCFKRDEDPSDLKHGLPDVPRLIKKPNGEPGRKGDRGYCLAEKLGWHTDRYATLQVSCRPSRLCE